MDAELRSNPKDGGSPVQASGQTYVAKFTELPASDDLARAGAGRDQHGAERRVTDDPNAHATPRVLELRAVGTAWTLTSEPRRRADGRFHSNSEITLDRDGAAPRFHGKVTAAAHSVDYGDRPGYVRRDSIFRRTRDRGRLDPVP
jgi:hypothetical protein